MSLPVTADQARGFVQRRYGLRVLHPLIDLPQGVHSLAWLAHTDDGEWVVKVSDPRSDSPATLLSQCELYAFLNSRGLHAPVVKVNRAGHHVSTITLFAGTYPITLMRYHQLRRLEPESVSADDLRQVAAQVARLHATMDEFPGKHEIILDRDKSLVEWGQQDEGCYEMLIGSPIVEYFTTAEKSWLRAIDTALLAHLDASFPDPAALSQAVLHGDLSFEHVRFLPSREVYFFDFGDMSWGPIAHELAWFLQGFPQCSDLFRALGRPPALAAGGLPLAERVHRDRRSGNRCLPSQPRRGSGQVHRRIEHQRAVTRHRGSDPEHLSTGRGCATATSPFHLTEPRAAHPHAGRRQTVL